MVIIAAFAGSFIPVSTQAGLSNTPRRKDDLDRLLRLLPSIQARRELGAAYLTAYAGKIDLIADANALASKISFPLDAPHSGGSIHSTFQKICADDFLRGDIVDLDGWQLSRSELTVCALLASRNSDDH